MQPPSSFSSAPDEFFPRGVSRGVHKTREASGRAMAARGERSRSRSFAAVVAGFVLAAFVASPVLAGDVPLRKQIDAEVKGAWAKEKLEEKRPFFLLLTEPSDPAELLKAIEGSDTVLVFTASQAAKPAVSEEGTRVSCLIRWPGKIAPATISNDTDAEEFCAENESPDLSRTRITAGQIQCAFEHLKNPQRPTDFDAA